MLSNSSSIPSSTKQYSTNNLVDLPYSDKERVIAFMQTRFLSGKVYTWAGTTLLCVQTFRDAANSVYSFNDNNNEQTDCGSPMPSIDSVVERTLFRLNNRLGKSNQSIVISGESGSGKTYSTCLAMKCLASREQSFDGGTYRKRRHLEDILWQIWSSVPVLGAFGNAPTVLNNNSSRFGKLLQLQYENGFIKGAFIKTYLLEKSRVCNVNPKEGNFHIFRQILDSLEENSLNALGLSKNVQYKIAPKIGLQSTYFETIKALDILNINELDGILKILSLILNLGNLEFIICGENYIVNPETFEFLCNAADILRVRHEILSDLLCFKQIVTKPGSRRNTIYKLACQNLEECEERRDCSMKFLYGKLFKWLVNCINAKIYNREAAEQHLGLLDIYGFEVFDHNTFEQLCINYANERLQYYFVKNYLLEERDQLISEGFNVEDFEHSDHAERINILDGIISVFGILNEECVMKRFKNDLHVTLRMGQDLRGRKHFFVNDELETFFSIRHYAGVVKYDTVSMIPKNKDKVPEDLQTFFRNSHFEFLSFIVEEDSPVISAGCRTLLTYFKRSLDNLVKTLDNSDVHYVKCLNPNAFKIALFFDENYFTHQMTINGVFEILKLSFQNYSVRIHIDDFVDQFGDLEELKKPLHDQIHIGTSFVYMTELGYLQTKRLKLMKLNVAARKIQRKWKNYYGNRNIAASIIQNFMRKHFYKKEKSLIFEKFIDISKRNSELTTANLLETFDVFLKTTSPRQKIYNFLRKNRVEYNFEGDCLSLLLEKTYNELNTKPFKRVLFCGDRIVSYNKLPENPLRLHFSKYMQYLLPKIENPKGLEDIF